MAKRGRRPVRKWIQKAKPKKGALHRQLGIPAGEKIPVTLLRRCAHAPGVLGRRCRLALTLRRISKKRLGGKR